MKINEQPTFDFWLKYDIPLITLQLAENTKFEFVSDNYTGSVENGSLCRWRFLCPEGLRCRLNCSHIFVPVRLITYNIFIAQSYLQSTKTRSSGVVHWSIQVNAKIFQLLKRNNLVVRWNCKSQSHIMYYLISVFIQPHPTVHQSCSQDSAATDNKISRIFKESTSADFSEFAAEEIQIHWLGIQFKSLFNFNKDFKISTSFQSTSS